MSRNPGGGGARTVWEKNTPDLLVDLAARCVLAHPECLFSIGRADEEDSTADVALNVELSSNPSTSSTGNSSTDLQKESTTLSTSNSADSTVKLSIEIKAERGGTIDESPSTKSVDDKGHRRFALHKGLRLPAEICETLFTMMHEEGLDLEDNFAMAFSDPTVSR
jgi:hypothetical protein